MAERITAIEERVIDLTQAKQHKLQIRLNKNKEEMAQRSGLS